MQNPFSWDYLTAPLRDTPTFGVFSIIFLVIFGGVFIGSAVAWFMAGRKKDLNPILRTAIHNGSQIMLWLTGTGLLLFSFRLMRVTFLNLYMRIWIYLIFLVFIAVVVWFIYYMKTTYPVKLAEYEKRRERRRYTREAEKRARSRGRGGSARAARSR
jgi:hypothetical protein